MVLRWGVIQILVEESDLLSGLLQLFLKLVDAERHSERIHAEKKKND